MNYITSQLKDTMFPQGDIHKEKMNHKTAQNWLFSNKLTLIDPVKMRPYYIALAYDFDINIDYNDRKEEIELQKNDTVLCFSIDLMHVKTNERHINKMLGKSKFSFSLYTIT